MLFLTTPAVKRRAVVIALIGVLVPVLVGMVVLTIDVGVIFNTKADLQNAADAGALAAVGVLATNRGDVGVPIARAAAADIVHRFRTIGRQLVIDPNVDVVFGQVEFNPITNQFSFTPTEILPDGARVTVRRTANSPNGPVPLFFAGIFGKSMSSISASATSALTGARDLAVTIDLSGSMKYDSDLRFYDQTQINARDIWASLDGPVPSKPYIPGAEYETEYAGDSGPTIGVMGTWGDPIDPVTYDPTTDPGLWYIPDDQPCTVPDIAASLNARGYSAAQIDTLMNGPGAQWTNRTAVMIGLAEWSESGPGDTSVDNVELIWIPYPPYRKNWSWLDYLGWASEANSKLTNVHPQFQFRFGVKTYVDFLLDRKDHFSQTDLTHTPEEPLRSVKDGVQAMVDMTRSFDQMSLEVFGSTGWHEIDLSTDRQAVADRLYQMQPNYYDNSTNIGAGLQQAINELTGLRARAEAHKTIVLMGDGGNRAGPDPISVAQVAADLGIRIYTVSVGYSADRPLMQGIAAIGGGREFYAYGTPEEYTTQLQVIFRTLGGLGVPALIE